MAAARRQFRGSNGPGDDCSVRPPREGRKWPVCGGCWLRHRPNDRLLTSLGLEPVGIDLSAGMIEVARRNNPGLKLDVGELANLPHGDQQLDGIFAWYSIIHLEPGDLPGVFAEFFRVLVPGGYVLVSFQAGEGRRHISRAYGHDVAMDAQLFLPARVSEQLADAGFTMIARMTREPGRLERTPQAVVLAQRPPWRP
jgi:SAM-dependent methyltransferase